MTALRHTIGLCGPRHQALRQLPDYRWECRQTTADLHAHDSLRRSSCPVQCHFVLVQIHPQPVVDHFDSADTIDGNQRSGHGLDKSVRRHDPVRHRNPPHSQDRLISATAGDYTPKFGIIPLSTFRSAPALTSIVSGAEHSGMVEPENSPSRKPIPLPRRTWASVTVAFVGLRSCVHTRLPRLRLPLKQTVTTFALAKNPSVQFSQTSRSCFGRPRKRQHRSLRQSAVVFGTLSYALRESRIGPVTPWQPLSRKFSADMQCATSK